MCNVRIPLVTSIETAIRIYYENTEIGNSQIKELFGGMSTRTIAKLKNLAKGQMLKDGIQSWNSRRVNTEAAYKSWGLDIADLERRYKKLKQLNMQSA